jgi:hypothetical protein
VAHDGMQPASKPACEESGAGTVCASCGGAGIHKALKSLHLLARSCEVGWICFAVVVTGETASSSEVSGTSTMACTSHSSRDQAGNTRRHRIFRSSELRLEMENISLVTNDAQMMSELSPTPMTT